MATNYGMLNNIASGVKEAMTAYQTNKTLQRQEQMQNLLQGARENPETGELEYTPEMKMKKEAEMRGLISDKNKSDPMSPESKQMQDWAKANGIANAENLSASQIEKLIPTVTTRMNNEAALKRAGLIDQYKKENEKSKTEKAESTEYVPGYEWNQKTPIEKPELRLLRDADASAKSFKFKLGEAKRLIEGATEMELVNPFSEKRKEIEGYLNNARLDYKGEAFAKLGVLSGPDKDILDSIIESPNAKNLMFSGGKKGVLERLNNANTTVDNSINNTFSSRGFTKQGEQPQGNVNPVGKGLIQQSTGQTVKVFDPKGNVRIIPKDQLDAAIKAGGKLAE